MGNSTISVRHRTGVVAGLFCAAFVAHAAVAIPSRSSDTVQPEAVPAAQPPATRKQQVESFVQPLIKAQIAPGVVVGVFEKGKTEYFGFGAFSATDARTPDEHTLFEIGSITKVFTAMLLADAAERGVCTLNDPLEKWLPQGVKAPERGDKKITLEQLAMHVSGLPRLPTNFKTAADADPYATYHSSDLWEFLGSYTLTRDPGAKYEYSNLGAGLLGCILASASGSSYETMVARRITGPLGMNDTVVTLSPDQQSRFAPPHREGVAGHTWTFDALAGAGAIRSTAADLMKFAVATLHPDKSPFPKTIEATLVKRPVSGGPVPMMGLGWHYAGDKSTALHTGQTGGYSSALFLAPSIDAAVIVLANGADSSIDATAEKLIQVLYGMNVKPAELAAPIAIDESQAALLSGTYVFGSGPTLTITNEGNVVRAKLTGQDAYRIYPSSPMRFFYRIVPAELEFSEPDAQGRPSKAILHQNGGKLPFVRTP